MTICEQSINQRRTHKNGAADQQNLFGADFANALGNTDEHVEAAARRLES